MKNRDLLDMLGDIDDGMIEDAAPDVSIKRRKKRPQNHYMKLIAIAACCTLILCGAMVAAPVINKIVYPDVATTETGAGEVTESPTGENGKIEDVESDSFGSGGAMCAPTEEPIEEPTEQPTSVEEEPTVAATEGGTRIPTGGPIEEPTESPTGGVVEEPYYGYNSFTDDERFVNCNITDSYCKSDLVGKKIADVIIKRQYEYYNSDTVYELKAEVNEVIGVEGEIYLCYRIVEVDEDLDLYVDCSTYYFMNSKDYQFSTVPEIKEQLFDKDSFDCGDMAQYFKQTEEDYCRHFEIDSELQDKVLDLLFSNESRALDLEGGAKLTEIEENSGESVRIYYYGTSLYSGWFRVFDSGYVCFSVLEFGDWLFEISEEVAQSIIDLIVYEGDPQGYIRNEKQGKWYPIVFDSLAQYPTFNEVLEENKLMGQIEFQEEIDYWETKFHGWSPDVLLLDRESRMLVEQVIYGANGDAVALEDITILASEGMTFTCVNNLTGSACYLTVYDSGHIRIDEHYYFVGTESTNAIMEIARTHCTTYYVNASYFRWNEKYECWETFSPEWYETETEFVYIGENDSETNTNEPDGEQIADVPNEYQTETPTEEPGYIETERFEDEYEVTE